MSRDAERPAYLLLGEVLRPHGIRGELRIRLLTDYPERINDLEVVYLGEDVDDRAAVPYHVEHLRLHQGFGLLQLHEIRDRNLAERMRQLYVMVAIDDAVPLEEGEFYLYELIGLEVRTDEGEVLGTLVEVIETGANDVYVVEGDRYGEILIPVLDSTILRTDIEQGTVIVRLPEGLLPAT